MQTYTMTSLAPTVGNYFLHAPPPRRHAPLCSHLNLGYAVMPAGVHLAVLVDACVL